MSESSRQPLSGKTPALRPGSRLVVTAITPGIATIQDRGRRGFERIGVCHAGAMDPVALSSANALAGNPLNAPAIEIGPGPASFRFEQDGACTPRLMSIAGAARNLLIDGELTQANRNIRISAPCDIRVGAALHGMFSYLTLDAGLDVEHQLGSSSTDQRAGLGQPVPRPLRTSDNIPLRLSRPESRIGPMRELITNPDEHHAPIRIVWGPQANRFSSSQREEFVQRGWQMSSRQDRTAYRFVGGGSQFLAESGYNIVSEPVVPGCVQVTGEGEPIVLMRDCGTIGGYVKIACVVEPDLPRFAQMQPGETVRFRPVTCDEAEAITAQYLAMLDDPQTYHPRPCSSALDPETLMRANLAGAACDALAS